VDHHSVFEGSEGLSLRCPSHFTKAVSIEGSIWRWRSGKLPKVRAISENSSCGTGSPGRRNPETAGFVDDDALDVVSLEEVLGKAIRNPSGVRRYPAGKSVGVDDVEVGVFSELSSASFMVPVKDTV